METQEPQQITFGMQLVGLDFNSSGDEKVTEVKQKLAEIIDLLERRISPETTYGERTRNDLFSLAINQLLIAQMCAVKAITRKHY